MDTGELTIRGGTHFEHSYIPTTIVMPALGTGTLRGMDLVAWYTGAWFDKYVKEDPSADARLLTTRWLNDQGESEVDPDGDGNMFSFYYDSRLDIDLAAGGHVTCETIRTGTANCPLADDGLPPTIPI